MANVELTFISVGDDAELDAELDDQMTTEQVVQALIQENFLTPLADTNRYYMLMIKGRTTIPDGQTLAQAGVQSGDQIRVSPTQRGGFNGAWHHV